MLIRAKLWNENEHAEALKDIIRNCRCSLVARPGNPPRISTSSAERGEKICIDVVFFEGIPHLHVEDRFSAYS
jgi:hypothetical protein